MTHVSILVPHGSLLSSILGLFKIFDLANQHAAKGAAFDVHLVGSASTADLYGGRFVIKPDLTLAEVTATDLAIIPAMAGNIAETIKHNSVFVPWIQKQYRSGCEIAGLCTGAFFIAETGLVHEKFCVSHWYVDATFRRQYSQVNSLAERAEVAAKSIHSDAGAWFFLQKFLGRVAGQKVASACTATYQNTFNRECQSVVSVSDARRQQPNRIEPKQRASGGARSVKELTMQRFVSLFELSHADRTSNPTMASRFQDLVRMSVGNASPKAMGATSEYRGQDRLGNHDTKSFKILLKKFERVDTN